MASIETRARRNASAAKELADAHAPAARRLQLVDRQRAGAASDVQRFARIEHGARSASAAYNASTPDLHRFTAEPRQRAGRWPKRAHSALELRRRMRPA